MLVKLLAAGPDGVAQSDLGRLLDLKPNVVTQALNALEEAGFAERLRGEGADGRTRTARATGAGEEHVARANASIVERLYALFPTEDADHRAILGSVHRRRREHRPAALRRRRLPLRRLARPRVARAGEARDGGRPAPRGGGAARRVPRAPAPRRGGRAPARGKPRHAAADEPRGRGPRRGRPGRARMDAAPRQPERPQGRVRGSHRRGRAQAEGHRPHRRRPRAHAAMGAPRTKTGGAPSPAPGASSSPTSRRARSSTARPRSSSCSPSSDVPKGDGPHWDVWHKRAAFSLQAPSSRNRQVEVTVFAALKLSHSQRRGSDFADLRKRSSPSKQVDQKGPLTHRNASQRSKR